MRRLILFAILIFLFGISACSVTSMKSDSLEEGMKDNNDGDNKTVCGSALIKRGGKLLLFIDPKDPDEIPIEFESLDDYINYLEEQKAKGIECPVLFMQQENDTQGNDVYRIRPSPINQQGGMQPIDVAPIKDANRLNYPYNSNQYPGFDPLGLQIGVYNELDQIHDSTGTIPISDSPMDPNWGGAEHTRNIVEGGKYSDNVVEKPLYFKPKTVFLPDTFGKKNPPSYTPSTGPTE
jgi:hypothetical protein